MLINVDSRIIIDAKSTLWKKHAGPFIHAVDVDCLHIRHSGLVTDVDMYRENTMMNATTERLFQSSFLKQNRC